MTTAAGSDFNSNDFLSAVKCPDPVSGDPSNTSKETYTVNSLGEVKTFTDRNGSTHTYTRDVLGRLTVDAVTTLGAGVDGGVRRLETSYDTAGRPEFFSSYDAAAGGALVRQVQRAYNGLGQLTTEYQAHGGVVNTATTPKVQYGYSLMAGGANHSRLLSLTYPNGRVLSYNYSAGLDDRISRLSSLSDAGITLEAETYLGLGTLVVRAHPQPGVDLSYVKRAGEANGDGGDAYTGVDRFGRVVDQRWLRPATGAATDRFGYGYDRDGNRLYRDNLVNPPSSEFYHANGAGQGYDSFNQLTAFARGTLNATKDTVATPSRSQSWALDGQGNWSSVTTDGAAQARTHNKQNELTAVGGVNLAYDANGNLTQDEAGKALTYDAWNHVVQVGAGAAAVKYGYDALGRRVTRQLGTGAVADGYYSADWQLLEERPGASGWSQYVWSPAYVDALVARDRDADGNGTLEQRLYAQQDANFNVTALLDTSGTVVERYAYDPYGKAAVLAADWTARAQSQYGWVYLHQGGRFDSDAGLYAFRNRDYSPTLGRWVSVDPIGFGGGDTNLYRYVGNGPTDTTDPRGLESPEEARRRAAREMREILAEHERRRAKVDFRPFAYAPIEKVGEPVGGCTRCHASFNFGLPDEEGQYSRPAKWFDPATGTIKPGYRLSLSGFIGFTNVADRVVLRGAPFRGTALTARDLSYGRADWADVVLSGARDVTVIGGFLNGPVAPSARRVFEVDWADPKQRAWAENWWQAQQAGHPKELTWDPSLTTANRKAAQAEVAGSIRNFLAKLFTRQIGSLDEYPPNATREAGPGSWVGHVPKSANLNQGGHLRSWAKQ